MGVDLFTYGTLAIGEVMEVVSGGGRRGTQVRAEDYSCRVLRGRIYPGMTPTAGQVTEGVLYRNVDADTMGVLDRFEDEIYERRSITVATAEGTKIACQAYVIPTSCADGLSEAPWDPAMFEERLLDAYLERCRTFRLFATGQRELRDGESNEAEALSALALRSKAYWGYDEAFMTACVGELTVSPAAFDRSTFVRAMSERPPSGETEGEQLAPSERDGDPTAPGQSPVGVMTAGPRLAGFYTLVPGGVGEVELEHLFVEPDAIGLGFGAALLGRAIDSAKTGGFQYLTIASDPNAEAFYRSMGAAVIGRQPSMSIPGRSLPLLRLNL